MHVHCTKASRRVPHISLIDSALPYIQCLYFLLGQTLVTGCRPTTSIKQREDVSQSTGGSKQKVNGRSDIVAFSPALGLQSPTVIIIRNQR